MRLNPAKIFTNPYFLLTLTALFWAGNAIVGRAAPGEISPAMLIFGRWSIATAILWALFGSLIVANWPAIKKTAWIPLGLGMIGFATFNLLLYYSLIFIPATNAAILQSGIPLFIFIVNFAVFRQKIRIVETIGFSLSLLGVAIIISRGSPLSLLSAPINIGDGIMIAGAFAYALYASLLRFKPEMDWRIFITLGITGAAIISALYALIEYQIGNSVPPASWTAWGFVLYAAIFPSIIGQAAFIRGVEVVGANRAGLFINLVPLFTALMAIVLLGEHFRLYHAISLILVVGGVMLAQKKSS